MKTKAYLHHEGALVTISILKLYEILWGEKTKVHLLYAKKAINLQETKGVVNIDNSMLVCEERCKHAQRIDSESCECVWMSCESESKLPAHIQRGLWIFVAHFGLL